MVWPFTSSSNNGSSSNAELDPSLQEFIKAQGPLRYSSSSGDESSTSQQQQQNGQSSASASSSSTSSSTSSSSPSITSSILQSLTSVRSQHEKSSNSISSSLKGQESESETGASRPNVPTLYPDGRYSHLWKTYRPLGEIEAETKTTGEKMADVLRAYGSRDQYVKKIALENCWPEGMEVQRCNEDPPTAHDRFTLCRDYTRRLERCFVTQARFLRALGYMSDPAAAPDQVKEEEIQLHADDLYRRMLAQERMAEEARAAGRPEPVFAPVLASEVSRATGATPVVVGSVMQQVAGADGSSKSPFSSSSPSSSSVVHSPTMDDMPDTQDEPALPPEASMVTEKVRERMRARLRRLSLEDRPIERLSMASEIQATKSAGLAYSEMALAQKAEREARRKDGAASIGDYVSGWLGW